MYVTVHYFVSSQVPLRTRATQLPGHTLTDDLQLCNHRFERITPLLPRLSPFQHFIWHKEGQDAHRTPRWQGTHTSAHAKSPYSRPTKRWCKSFGGVKICAARFSDALRGDQLSLICIQSIVVTCGHDHSGRQLTHKPERVFHAGWLT